MTNIMPPAGGPRIDVVGKAEGATRIWMAGMSLTPGFAVGLHRHGGDEILRVVTGTVRFHVEGRNTDVEAGGMVVVPPFTEHGFRVLTAEATLHVVGEIEMGEWITVIDPDGTHRQVEARSRIPMMPWHRPPTDGDGIDLPGLMGLFASTTGVFDEPS
jgi:quercetin dioxygenase-like cupin family protein